MDLAPGIYEELVSNRLQAWLESGDRNLIEVAELAGPNAEVAIATYVSKLLVRAMRARGQGRDSAELVVLANAVIELLRAEDPSSVDAGDDLQAPLEVLLSVVGC